MNDLIPRACCHISDKIGRNENRSIDAPVFTIFQFVMPVEFVQVLCKWANRVSVPPQPSGQRLWRRHQL